MTPDQFERRYGIPSKRLRSHLRNRWAHRKNDPWYLTDEMIQDALEHFGLGPGEVKVSDTPQGSIEPPSDRTPAEPEVA